jgi:uncharacterized protein (DUF2461 family)
MGGRGGRDRRRSGFLAHAAVYAPRARPPLRRLRHPVQVSQGNALAIMKGDQGPSKFGIRQGVIVQDKLPSSRFTALLGFVAIRLASRAHQ